MRGLRRPRCRILTRGATYLFVAAALLASGITLAPAAASSAAVSSVAAGTGHVTTMVSSGAYNWPELHRTPLLTGYAANSTVTTANASRLGVAWATSLYGAALDSPVVAYIPALHKTLAYIGTEHGYLIAVDLASGQIVWSTWLGGAIRTTPVVSDGSVYAGTDNSARVYRLNDSTGAVQCSIASPQPIEGTPVIATPPNGTRTLYTGTNDSQSTPGPVLAINAANCQLEWKFTSYARLSGSWTPISYAVDASKTPLILFGSADPDSRVYAVDANTGKTVWEYAAYNPAPHGFDIGAGATIAPPSGGSPGTAYVPSKYGIMYALNLTTGQKIWGFNFNKVLNAHEGGRSTAALDGTNLVFGYDRGIVDLNTASNPPTMRWHYTDPGGLEVLSSPAIAGPAGRQVVAAGDLGGGFDVLSQATGAQLYRYQTGGYVTASPAVSDGNILVASSDGFLYDFAVGGGNEANPPSTTITSPTNFSHVANPNGDLRVTGHAVDATGVARVEVAVQSGGADGSWWDAAGNRWVSGPVGNPATLASGGTATNWSFSYPVPPAGGTYAVTAYAVSVTGQAGIKGAQSHFSVDATTTGAHLATASSFVAPGGTVAVTGGGFGKSEKVTISLLGATLATTRTTTSGDIRSTRVVIPSETPFGLSSLTARGDTSGKVATAAISIANAWDQAGYDPAHTGYEPNDSTLFDLVHIGPNLFLDPAWQYQTGSAIGTAPAVADAVAYTGNSAGQLAAIDVYNGAPLWTAHVSPAALDGAPAVDPSHGLVFAGSGDGSLYAVSVRTGKTVWHTRIAGPAGKVSAPVYASGKVYVTSSTGTVEALTESHGAKKWARLLATGITAAPALDTAGTVVVGESNGKVKALDAATGTTKWTYPSGGAIAAPAMISGGTVYFGSADGSVYAVSEKTGARIWSYHTGGPVTDTPVISDQGTPGGVLEVLAGSADGNLYALKASSGSRLFSVAFGKPIIGVAAVRGVAIIDTSTGMIGGARTYTSLRLWEYQTSGSIAAPPVIVDGTVYAGAGDGELYAFTTYGQLPDSASRRPA